MMLWPPESLTIQTEDLINQCEMMELLPSSGEGKQFVPVVEMAALLYTGEYVHARHTWRRWKDSNPPSILVDWWKVGAAMSSLSFGDDNRNLIELGSTIWSGLRHIETTHPSPISGYAREVGAAFRQRILQMVPKQPPPQPFWSLLNFSSSHEYEQFCCDHGFSPKSRSRVGMGIDAKTSLTQVVAFLNSNPPSAVHKV